MYYLYLQLYWTHLYLSFQIKEREGYHSMIVYTNMGTVPDGNKKLSIGFRIYPLKSIGDIGPDGNMGTTSM